jgi:hypothetical protein
MVETFGALKLIPHIRLGFIFQLRLLFFLTGGSILLSLVREHSRKPASTFKMTAVMDLRIRTSKTEASFKFSTISFPEFSDRISDQIIEQMMMDGSVASLLRKINSRAKIHSSSFQFTTLWILIFDLETQHLANSSGVMDEGFNLFCSSGRRAADRCNSTIGNQEH